MTNLEQITFDSLEKVVRLYKESKNDSDRLYHLVNGISLLRALQTFINTKMELTLNNGKTASAIEDNKDGKANASAKAEAIVNVNVDGKDKK